MYVFDLEWMDLITIVDSLPPLQPLPSMLRRNSLPPFAGAHSLSPVDDSLPLSTEPSLGSLVSAGSPHLIGPPSTTTTTSTVPTLSTSTTPAVAGVSGASTSIHRSKSNLVLNPRASPSPAVLNTNMNTGLSSMAPSAGAVGVNGNGGNLSTTAANTSTTSATLGSGLVRGMITLRSGRIPENEPLGGPLGNPLSSGVSSSTHSPASGRSVSPTKGVSPLSETGGNNGSGNNGRRGRVPPLRDGGSVPPLPNSTVTKTFGMLMMVNEEEE